MKTETVVINGVQYTDYIDCNDKNTEERIIDAMDVAIVDELDTQLIDWFADNKKFGIDMCKHLLDENHWMWKRIKETIEDSLQTYIKYEEGK
tara:strand:+ start:224 stop:499 length:276 start_codon:yes stop_codon:yes gene_type:complete